MCSHYDVPGLASRQIRLEVEVPRGNRCQSVKFKDEMSIDFHLSAGVPCAKQENRATNVLGCRGHTKCPHSLS